MQRKRRGDVTRHTAHTTRRVRVRVSTARSAHRRRGRRRSVGTTTRSRLGARSAGFAGVGSDRAEPAMQRKRRGDVTRHAAHTTRRVRVRVSTARSAHRRRGRRRSVGTTTRSRLGARSAGFAGVGSDRAEPAMQRKRRGDVTRHTAHTTRRVRVRVSTARSAHRRRGRRRSVGTTTRSRLGARSAGFAGVGSDRAEPAMQRKSAGCNARGAVMSLDTRRTRHGEYVCACRRRDRRTDEEAGGARSARRLARGSALARRALPVSAQTEPSRRCNARGAVMSLDTRRTRHGEYVCACRRRDRRTDEEVGGARSARRLARGSALARRALPVSAQTEPSRRCNAGHGMQRKRRGDVTRHAAHTTRRVRVRVSTARSAHDEEVGGARSARRLARGSALARRALPVSAQTEPIRRCNARGAVMSLDTRRTRHGEYVCACRRRDRRTDEEVGGARSARRLARGSALARRALPVSAQTEPSRRCNARGAVMSLDTRRTRHGEYVCACRRRDRRTDEEVGGARSARRLARGSALARRALPVSAQTEPSRRCNARGAVMSLDTRRTRHGEYVCACRRRDRRTDEEVGGARSARRLARGSALARRACRCRLRQSRAGDDAEARMQRKRRGDVTRHAAHTTRRVRVRVSTARSAHRRRGRRRSVGTTARSRLGARSAGFAGVGSDRAEPAMQRKRRGDVTRHAAHTTRRVRARVSTARSVHARRGRRRSVGTTTRSRLGARSAGFAGVGSDRAEPAMQRKRRGDVTRHTAHTTRRVRVRVSTARSAHRRRGRRRSVGTTTRSRLGARSAGFAGVGSDRAEPAMQRKRRGDVTRHAAHTTRRVRVRVSTARSAHRRRGRRRSVGRTTRSRLGARSAGFAGVGSDRAEPAMQRKRRGDVTRHTAHTTRRVRVRVSTARSAHRRRGRRRSVGTTTRSRLGARSAGFAGVGSDRAEPAMQRKRRGDVTRHTAHTTRRVRVRVSTARSAHARRGRRRSVGTTTRSRLGARSAGFAGVGSDRAKPAMQRKRRGDVTRHAAHTTRRVRVRVSTARSVHARRGFRRSVGTTTRSRLGARSAGVAGVGSDRAEPAMQRKRRGDVTRHTAHTTRRVRVRVSTARSAHRRRGRRRSVGTTTRSRLGARSAGFACVGSDRAEPAMQRKRRGDVTRHAAHTTRRVRVRVSTARSAHRRRGRRRSVGTNDSLAARRSLGGLAGVGSDRAEPAMQRKRRGDVTRHTAHTTRRVRVRVSTARSAHRRRGRRRSVGTTTRSRLGARSAGFACVGSDRAEPAMQRKRRGDVTRHTAHTTRRVRVRVSTARSAHRRRGRRRSVGTTTRSRLGARSAGFAVVGSDRAEPAMQRKRRGDVTRHTAHTTRRVRVRVSTARSAHRRRGRRRSVGTTTRSRLGARSAGLPVSAQTEPSRRCNARGAVMSPDTRRTRHGEYVCACRRRDRRTRRRGRRRSVGTTTRSRLGARSAGFACVGSDRADPAMQRKRRGDVTRHAAHTTRRVRVRVSTARSVHARRGFRRPVGTTTRSRLGARSAGLPVSAQTEPSRRCNARGAVMSLDTRRTRHGEYVCACRRRDRAPTKWTAALGRHDDSLAARRSLGGLCMCRLRQSRAGDATQEAR